MYGFEGALVMMVSPAFICARVCWERRAKDWILELNVVTHPFLHFSIWLAMLGVNMNSTWEPYSVTSSIVSFITWVP